MKKPKQNGNRTDQLVAASNQTERKCTERTNSIEQAERFEWSASEGALIVLGTV